MSSSIGPSADFRDFPTKKEIEPADCVFESSSKNRGLELMGNFRLIKGK